MKTKSFKEFVRGKWITFTLPVSELKAPQDKVRAKITSFATFKDCVGYIDCLLKGGTENGCYSKGDNGRGSWGDLTAQIHTPMCAVSPQAMIRKWGSSKAARGKLVMVKLLTSNRGVTCEVRDKGPDGVCDINPAALDRLGLPIDTELSEVGTWEWL